MFFGSLALLKLDQHFNATPCLWTVITL